MTGDRAALTERYVGLWNEASTELRRRTIEDLWAPEGANFTQSAEAVGYDALEGRVTRSYEAYVGSGEYRFRSAAPAVEHHDAVKVHWEMVRTDDGSVASTGPSSS